MIMKTYKEIVHELFLKELSDVHQISTQEVNDKIGKGSVRYSIELQDQAAKIYARQCCEDFRERICDNFEYFTERNYIMKSVIILP